MGAGRCQDIFPGSQEVVAVGTMREVPPGPQARPAACHAPGDAGRAVGPTDPESQAQDEVVQPSGSPSS